MRPGKGVSGKVDGPHVALGNRRLLAHIGIEPNGLLKEGDPFGPKAKP